MVFRIHLDCPALVAYWLGLHLESRRHRNWSPLCFVKFSYLSRSLADHWGTTVDFTTSFLHSLQFLAFRSIFHSRPVYSLMLSPHCFLHLLLCLPPWTVPCLCQSGWSCDVPVPLQFTSVHWSQEVFIRPDGVSNSGFHFLIGYLISVQDTKEFAETSHLQYLYPSFNVCCYGPCFTCIRKYGHGQGMHQSHLGADEDVLVKFYLWLKNWHSNDYLAKCHIIHVAPIEPSVSSLWLGEIAALSISV